MKWYVIKDNGSGDKKQTQVSTSQGTNEYAWLFDYTDSCTNYGCNIADSSTYGYWTSSSVSNLSSGAWGILYDGSLLYFGVNYTNYGIRPVITIPKNVIK